MWLECRKCKEQFDYPRDSKPGIPDDHNEHLCENCGQLLIWDYPQVRDAPTPPGDYSKPEECHHAQLKKPGAMVPRRPGLNSN
jgi:hypothetical protein